MGTQADQYEVFLSYHWRDHEAVECIAESLATRGLRVFFDRWYLKPGTPWPQTLEQILGRCHAVAVCVGPEGMGPWQLREQFLALDRQSRDESFPVIPVLLPGADLPLGFLKLNTWVTLRTGVDDALALESIARAVRGLSPGDGVRAQPAICPYRGLQAFREEDAPFFFGREAFSESLVEEVKHKSLIAVVGASGSGKSSVVRAGLVPHLRASSDGHVWDILTLTPGSRPMHALAASLIPVLEPDLAGVAQLAKIGELVQHFTSSLVSLQDAALQCLKNQPGTDRLLLFVDQWEELYTACKDEEARRWFIDQLLATSADAPVTVILTLRGDFYGRALTHRGLVDRLQDAKLGPMSREELRVALEKPAKEVRLEFEPGLVDHILDEVGYEPGNLPLLEFMLKELWEKRYRHRLHFEAYKELGGIKGAIATRADNVFEKELTDEQRKTARRVLMQLVRPGEGTPDTRRRAVLPTEDESVLAVVHKLATARLLVTGRDETRSGAQTVEIAHEALIHHWSRLQHWVDEDREFLRTRERIEAAAALWNQEGQAEDRLLAPGRPLAEAEDLLAKRRPHLNTSLIAFIEASVAAETSRQEAQRKKWRRTAIAAVALALVMTALSLFALNRWRAADEASKLATELKEEADRERNRALEQSKIAVSRSLAAQASLLVERGPSEDFLLRAAALAVESWKRVQNPDAYSVAMKLLEWHPVCRIEADPKSPSSPAVVFSPNGRFLVIDSIPAIRLVETSSGRELLRDEEEKRFFPAVQFSSDSRFVRLGARLIDTENAKEVFSASAGKFKSHHTLSVIGSGSSVATMSPNSRWAALTSADSDWRTDGVTIVDMHTGKEACRIEHRQESREAMMGLAFSPDETCLVIMDYRAGTVRLMNVPSGRERARITVNDASIVVGFIGTGQYLLIKSSSDSGQRLHFIDPETGRELSSIHLRKDDWQHFSSDGQRMVAKDGNEVRLLEVPTGKEVAHWDESFNQFFFDFDSSGQWLVLRSASGLIRLIDSASGREKSRTELKCETSDYWRDPVALRADADLLVLACQEGDIRTLVASTGAETVTFKAQGRGLALSPDARLVITQDEGQSVMRFRETRTGREFGKLATSGWVGFLPSLVSIGFIPNPPGQPAFSADGRYMALPGPKGDVQLVDLSSAYSPLKLDSSYERQAILSRDRRFLAFAGSDQIVRVVDMTTGSEVGSLHSDEPTFPEHISSDGRFLITAQKSMLKLNEIESGREVARLQKTSGISFAQASPDGNYLVISYAEREGGLLASSSLREIMTYPSDERSWKRTFSPDGRLFAVPNRYNYTVQVFDTAGGAERLKISSDEITKSMGPWGAEFSPDGKELAVSVPNTVRIYDIATGTEKLRMKYKLPPGVMGPQSSSFSPDGRTLAIWGTVFKGLCVELHDIDTGKELLTVQSGVFGGGETSEPWGRFQIAFSPDSRLFAVGAAVGDPVRLFEAATGKELAHIELGWGFKGVLFSPDGRTLAAASNNGSVRLLDVESLKVIGNCQHAKAVTHMEFSPDSRFLITSGNAGTALMMDTANGKEIARFEHGAPLTQASFSHDGQSLLTVSDDKIKLWPVDPEWPFQQFCARSGRNLSREEWKSYIGESEPWQPTCPNWRTEKVPDLHR